MKSLNAAARALANTILLDTHDNRRLVIAVHQTRSHNADDTRIPIFPGHHDSWHIIRVFSRQLCFSQLQDILLDCLTLAIQHIKFRRQLIGFFLAFRKQQPDAFDARTNPSCRIEPRSQLKADMTGIYGLVLNACHLDQRPDTGKRRLLHCSQSFLHDTPILTS